MKDCVFCKIVSGDIPSYKVYEDDHVLAFLDLTQGTKGHTLVIPKHHVKNIYELDQSTATQVFTAVPKVAKALKDAFKPIGLNVVQNNDKPLQSVFHFHVHLLPRYENDGMVLRTLNLQDDLEQEDYQNIQDAIKQAL